MLVARVRRTLADRKLIPSGSRVLVACSGGPDSAALLFALSELAPELGLTLEAASVDHGLRVDAAQDVEQARLQAQHAGVPFHALRVTVEPSGSVQAAARAARYEALHTLAGRIGASRVAVGHTQDDQAETVLLRMLRGSGLSGLAAIAPLREDGVVRPLIDCPRAEVHAFVSRRAQELGAAIAQDPSNQDPGFSRVRVRTELLEWLVREDPQVIAHLAAIADDARAAQEALLELASARVREILHVRQPFSGPAEMPQPPLNVSSWLKDPPAILRLSLRELLRELTKLELGRAHLEQLERALRQGGEVWLSGSWVAVSQGDGHLAVTLGPTKRT